jgi:hypothetical protein
MLPLGLALRLGFQPLAKAIMFAISSSSLTQLATYRSTAMEE